MTLQPQSIVAKQTKPLLPPFAGTLPATDHLTDDNRKEPDTRHPAMLRGADLPGTDGEPMENEREGFQIQLGLDCLNQHWRDRDDFYTGGNMFVYYSIPQAKAVLEELAHPERPKKAFRGPDMFAVLNVDGSYRRQKWVVWEEQGRHPDVIFEFLSPSTRKTDLTVKKRIYERIFKTVEYYCFDYLNPTGEDSLLGWRLDGSGIYQLIDADSRGWLWSEKLELFVGRWTGRYNRDPTVWMRFYKSNGELAPTLGEAMQQHAAQEARRAKKEARRAEKEARRAEKEARRAEKEARRAEKEARRAEKETLRAEKEAHRAEKADKHAESLAAQLRALGVEPDLGFK